MVKKVANDALTTPLVLEQEALGADFIDTGSLWVPGSYGEVQDEVDAYKDNTLIVDVTSMGVIAVSGKSSTLFLNTMTTAPVNSMVLGDVRFGLALTGEAEIIDVVLINKTGDESYTVYCSSENLTELYLWLEAHAALQQNKVKAFEDVSVSNESSKLAALAVLGKGAATVLSDYLTDDAVLPAPGTIAPVKLDNFDVLVSAVELPDITTVYFLLVAPHDVVTLFRSFMSFEQVMPAGLEALRILIQRSYPGYGLVLQAAYTTPKEGHLLDLVRSTKDFVGAKNLDV